MRDKGRVYGGGSGLSICVVSWDQCLFPFLLVYDLNVVSPDENVCGCNCVLYVILSIPDNNGSCTQAPVDEAGYDPDGILITEAPDFITVSMGE